MSQVNLRSLAFGLLALTLLYNVAEGLIAVAAGLQAHSLVLLAFGADSYLEVLAAAAVIWRLSTRDEEAGERVERIAMRLIGATFLMLTAAVIFQSTLALLGGEGADESPVGIGLLFASVVIMPVFALAKLWTAARLPMPILAAEAKETIACSYLSLTALGGLLATAVVGHAWVDPVAALLMTPWLVREGLEGVRADACLEDTGVCFCRSCFFGLRDCPPIDSCVPRCC